MTLVRMRTQLLSKQTKNEDPTCHIQNCDINCVYPCHLRCLNELWTNSCWKLGMIMNLEKTTLGNNYLISNRIIIPKVP